MCRCRRLNGGQLSTSRPPIPLLGAGLLEIGRSSPGIDSGKAWTVSGRVVSGRRDSCGDAMGAVAVERPLCGIALD